MKGENGHPGSMVPALLSGQWVLGEVVQLWAKPRSSKGKKERNERVGYPNSSSASKVWVAPPSQRLLEPLIPDSFHSDGELFGRTGVLGWEVGAGQGQLHKTVSNLSLEEVKAVLWNDLEPGDLGRLLDKISIKLRLNFLSPCPPYQHVHFD